MLMDLSATAAPTIRRALGAHCRMNSLIRRATALAFAAAVVVLPAACSDDGDGAETDGEMEDIDRNSGGRGG